MKTLTSNSFNGLSGSAGMVTARDTRYGTILSGRCHQPGRTTPQQKDQRALFARVGRGFPWATLAVNLAGCFLIGLLWGLFSRNWSDNSSWALFLTVGVCGGFTTFSTFSKESLLLLQGGNIWAFTAYVAISIIAGIALVAVGYYLAR